MSSLVLSTSSISEYLRCNYRYYLDHVLRVKAGKRQSVSAAIGQAVHSAVEAIYTSPLRPESVLEQTWIKETATITADDLNADPDALPDARRMLTVYQRHIAPGFHPTMIERPFALDTLGVTVTGNIDTADEENDDLADLKTTAGKTINGRKPRFNPSAYDLQLTLYSWGYRGLTGRMPKRLRLNVVTRRGAHRIYDREPQHRDAIDAVGVVRDGILRGHFEPTGVLSGSCSYCPFVGVCKYAVID